MDGLGLTTGNYVVLICVVLPTLYLFYRYIGRNDNYWKERGVNFEPRASWFKVLKFILTQNIFVLDLELERYKKYGRVHGVFEGSKPSLTVGDPDVLRDVFVKEFPSFSSRRVFDLDDPVVGSMVSVLNGEQWRRVRAIITPAFTSGKMRKMTTMINDCSKVVLENLLRDSENGVPSECKKIFGAFTMDVIASCAFATRIDSHNDPNNPFVAQIQKALGKSITLKVLLYVFLPTFIRRLFGIKLFDQETVRFFRDVTLQVIEERKRKGVKGNDFLQLMMDANAEQCEPENKTEGFHLLEVHADESDIYGQQEKSPHVFKANNKNKKLSQDEVLAQCILFFTVGYETTGSTLSFTAYNLATHPDCQEKLIQEIDRIMKEKGELTYDSIREMKYLDNVISESLRMYPPLIRTERTADEEHNLGTTGITLPKGMIVGIPIYALHYDPEYFPEPEKFIPERFSPENVRHPPYAFLPFGAGPRNCLGMRFALMEVKLCLVNILSSVRLKVCPETKVPLEFKKGAGFWNPKGLVLSVEKRKDK